jgi:hypothetical protein
VSFPDIAQGERVSLRTIYNVLPEGTDPETGGPYTFNGNTAASQELRDALRDQGVGRYRSVPGATDMLGFIATTYRDLNNNDTGVPVPQSDIDRIRAGMESAATAANIPLTQIREESTTSIDNYLANTTRTANVIITYNNNAGNPTGLALMNNGYLFAGIAQLTQGTANASGEENFTAMTEIGGSGPLTGLMDTPDGTGDFIDLGPNAQQIGNVIYSVFSPTGPQIRNSYRFDN